MTRYAITVEPHTSLYVGGYAQASGESDGDTAADLAGVLIPGSTVKGALRESAVRLVNAVDRGHDLLDGLFGDTGVEGALRIGPLRPERPAPATSEAGFAFHAFPAPELSSRQHVSLTRQTRQAAPQLLFQNRVTAAGRGLCFRGELTTARELEPEELGLLQAAAQITDQVGGGRGRGLGLVRIELSELPAEEVASPACELPAGRSTITLVFEVEEPLHLGAVKDLSNYAPSKDYLDASTVRGAVAAALGQVAGEAELELVVGGPAPVVFGDGRAGQACAIPAPMTLRQLKQGGDLPSGDDAAALCAEALGGRPFEPPEDTTVAKGTFKQDSRGWVRVGMMRRAVTRTARDHRSGRSAEGQLFTLEVIDPFAGPAERAGRVRFYVPVTGTREQLELVIRAAAAGLLVGGTRSRGCGRLRLSKVLVEPALPQSVEKRHQRWAACVERLGVAEEDARATGVLTALGPLAVNQERLKRALAEVELELVEGVARRAAHGGWNTEQGLPRTVSSHFLPGSVFIVRHRDGKPAQPALRELEDQGIGPGRPDGWGRIVACHPIHVDCCKEK